MTSMAREIEGRATEVDAGTMLLQRWSVVREPSTSRPFAPARGSN
jgi:hypothetical protein